MTREHRASPHTVARRPRTLGSSPKTNVRRTDVRSTARSTPPERHAPFRQIAARHADVHATGDPVIPTGCSTWNPLEHRLCSPISLNWAGVPLRTFETVVQYFNGTTTGTGLTVTGVSKRGGVAAGERVPDAAIQALRLRPHAVCPQWNYTLTSHRRCDAH